MKVFIVGFSLDSNRYSNIAHHLLNKYNHTVVDINPSLPNPVEPSVDSATKIYGSPHTITMYVKPEISSSMIKQILNAQPKRVIFNPGSENPDLMDKLKKSGIEVVEGCTLVMLKTNQF